MVQALHQNSHMLIQLARDLHSERSTLPTNVEPGKPCGLKEASFGAPGPKGVRHFHLQRNQFWGTPFSFAKKPIESQAPKFGKSLK